MAEHGPYNSEQCRESLFDGRARVEALLWRIDDVTRDGEDGWSAKDHLLHLAIWQQRVVDHFAAGVAGTPMQWPEPGFTMERIDELNERDWQAGRDRSMEDIQQAFTTSYDGVDALFQSLTDEELNAPDRYPWIGFEAGAAIVGNSYGHYGDHIDALEELVLSSEFPE